MYLTIYCLLLFSLSLDSAQERPPVPLSSPVSSMQETTETQYGSMKRVAISDDDAAARELGLTEVLRCETVERPRNPAEFSFRVPVDHEIEQGEVLVLRFHARTVYARTESGLGVIQPFFERNAQRSDTPNTPPNTRPSVSRSLNRRVEIGREWKEYSLPFKAVTSSAPGECNFGVALGFQEQIVEIAGFALYSYGTDFDIMTIPDTIPRYRGQETDAPWRKAAEERIEQIRKGDLQIKVVDAAGKPVADADVEIRMKRHAFGWGSAVVARHIMGRNADSDRYREIIEKYFNRVVFENDMKWYMWLNDRNRDSVFQAVEWLRERDIDIRGHCLIWPSWRNTPRHLRDLENSPEELKKEIADHIRDEATALRGSLIDWDVINEPYDNNDVMKILGNEEMVEWFKLARECDPEVKLFLNDYGILSGEGLDRRHQNFMYDTLKFLIDNGAPVDGIGFQGHFGTTATPPERLLEILDRFAEFGLPIAITEHDIDSTDEVFQAEFTRDFLTAMFSHPSVESVLVWGFWERSHWRPNGAYYRVDWSLKPAGKIWLDLVTKQWWSDFDKKTDASGTVSVRGFLGDYEITVRSGNQSKTVTAVIVNDGTQLEITLH